MDTRKRLQYLRAFIVLTAGLIVFVCDFMNHVALTPMLVRLLVVLIAFYMIGSIVIWAIGKALEMPNKEDEAAEKIATEQQENENENDEGTEQTEEATE